MFVEILIIAVLTLVNGVLAMSELAVVSSRAARLKILAAEGKKGAEVALRLAENPGRFLSSVQIGITLVGVLSGAFSGATLGGRLSSWLASVGLSQNVADPLGVGIVVVIITYLSLIIGELVPKQIALRDPERIAARVAPTMKMLATIGALCEYLPQPENRVTLDSETDRYGLPVAHFSYSLCDNDRQLLDAARHTQSQILEAAGATEVITIDRNAHLVGGARMSATPQTGVVDRDLRTWAIPNLYVVDGSVLPTQGAANPALTIMALAARAADRLAVGARNGAASTAGRR